jgi:hypothetical protein
MLSVNALRPADIICSTTDAAISAVIRAGIGSSVSHCMIYVGGSFVIEAVGEGVRRRPITVAIGNASLAIALRRRMLTEKQRSAVLGFASAFEARHLPYDALGAAGAGVATGSKGAVLAGFGCQVYLPICALAGGSVMDNARPENADKAFFCSELVARCFELAGAPVVEGPSSFAAPRAIRMANTLLYLGKLKDTPRPEPGIPFGSPL